MCTLHALLSLSLSRHSICLRSSSLLSSGFSTTRAPPRSFRTTLNSYSLLRPSLSQDYLQASKLRYLQRLYSRLAAEFLPYNSDFAWYIAFSFSPYKKARAPKHLLRTHIYPTHPLHALPTSLSSLFNRTRLVLPSAATALATSLTPSLLTRCTGFTQLN